MKIGINASLLAIPYECGLKNYTKSLLINLAKIDSENIYYVYVVKSSKIKLPKNFHFIEIPRFPIFKRQILLPYLVKKYNLDLFHYLEPYGSIFLKHPKIITTVHDVDLEQTYPLFSKYIIARLFSEISRYFVFRNTNKFITDSQTISQELKSFIDQEHELDINIINLAVDEIYTKSKITTNSKKYFLAMGDFAKRKNIITTIKAYSLLPLKIKSIYPLKIITSTKSAANRFIDAANELDIVSNIQVLINISDNELVNCYRSAVAFLYPSLYEGFGLPIIEAMSCGCPVITSNYGVMKEISGEAGLNIDPLSPIEITKIMEKLVINSSYRASISKRSIKWSKKFRWKDTAMNTLKCYNQVFEKKDI